jgi:predicted alpha/beta-fold hydrolase
LWIPQAGADTEMTPDDTDKRIVRSAFRPARWLRNRHAQTIYPSFPWAWRERPALRREVLKLPDGDETAVDWVIETEGTPKSAPLLIILHGLESSAESAYARMLMHAAASRQWRCCVLHFRDCGDYRNVLPRRYHAGETNDIRYFVAKLERQGQLGPMVAAGYSLGGNVLLKYLGESGAGCPLKGAAAVCVPLNLHECAEALNKGISRGYQNYLLRRMKRSVGRKFDPHTAAFDWQRAMQSRTFAEFDDAVTAPLHGFAGKDDYYDRCSSVHFLKSIERPTLIVNALDDPFMTPEVIPGGRVLSEHVTLEVSEHGGHVGFIEGGSPWRPRFYLPERLIGFLEPLTAKPGM